jgi:hypothetical protein
MSKRNASPAPKLCVALLLAACSTALGVDGVQQLPPAADELMRMYPGSQVHKEQDRVRMIYGVPMTPGLNARGAATTFLQMHGDAFGCGPLEVSEVWSSDISRGAKTVFAYQQYIHGVPVELGTLRVLVLNGPVPRVVYAAGNLAPQLPEAATARPAISDQRALQNVRKMEAWQRIQQWSKPELVIFQGNGDWIAPVVTWKFVGESADPADQLCKTFFVDAATGVLVFVRDETHNTDVNGSIQGKGSPGVLPDVAYNLPTLLNVPGMRASITGGNSAYTGTDGLFTITNPGTSPVTVTCGVNGVGAGQWVNVVPTTVPVGTIPITASLSNVTPPGPAPLVLNPTPAEGLTAQVNAFICATVTHNYFRSRAPGFAALDMQLLCNTGVSGTCNAFYQSSNQSINFYNAGGGCVNSAYTTVVSHEYGHFIVNRLNLAQNAFGEGYGDTNAAMIWDDTVVARDFYGPGSPIRNPYTANVQYPCSNEIHFCGQVIAGIWWGIRLNMGTFYGEPQGLTDTRQLEVDWSLITAGGPDGSNSAGPATAIEALTADDDDGNIGNGTPNYARICAAFASHNIQCPVLVFLTFQYPNGRPTQLTPNQAFLVPVNVAGVTGTPQPGSGALNYRIGTSGAFTTVPMAQGNPNEYTATLPAIACGQDLQYYVSARTTANLLVSDPGNAPTSFFSASATGGGATVQVTSLDFNTDPGWTVTNDPSLTTGAWERVTPTPGAGTGTPPSGFGGSGLCWVTDNRVGNFDVDGGPTTLTSNIFDLSAYPRITVSYQRWLYSTGADPMSFEYSSNGGTTWTVLESTQGTATTAWTLRSFDIPAPTSTMAFRWRISDSPNDSVTEGGVDSFAITALVCSNACYANCDGSTTQPVLNVSDFSCFLNRFASGDSYANCDGSTTDPVLNVADFACFLNAFGAGCS